MRRRLLNLVVAFSLVLCLVTVAMWVRSGSNRDEIVFSLPSDRLWRLNCYRGYISAEMWSGWPGPQPIRWLRDGGMQYMFGQGDVTHRTILGMLFVTRHCNVATRLNGTGYISEKDGPLPQHETYGTGYGFYMMPSYWSRKVVLRSVSVRADVLAISLGLLPVVYLTRWILATTISKYRQRRGHCPACGYDLRGTPARCPECGTVPNHDSGNDIDRHLPTG